MNPFRPIALAAAVLSAAALVPAVAQAQSFPEKSITFVVPFAAGTATDQIARAGEAARGVQGADPAYNVEHQR